MLALPLELIGLRSEGNRKTGDSLVALLQQCLIGASDQRLRLIMQSEEFSNYAKLRNGVETVPANIRKNYRLDKLPRGKQRGKFFFGSKIAALNFRKLFGFRKGLVNYAQNPIFG